MDNIKIQEVLRAIEQDAIKGENEYESFQKNSEELESKEY